jgi:hypothetical protein
LLTINPLERYYFIKLIAQLRREKKRSHQAAGSASLLCWGCFNLQKKKAVSMDAAFFYLPINLLLINHLRQTVVTFVDILVKMHRAVVVNPSREIPNEGDFGFKRYPFF